MPVIEGNPDRQNETETFGPQSIDGSRAGWFIITVILLLVLAASLIWLVLQRNEPPSSPVLASPPSSVTSPFLNLSGVADPHSFITIRAAGLSDIQAVANDQGIFEAEAPLSELREYHFTAQARNSKGVAGLNSLPVSSTYTNKPDQLRQSARNIVAFASFRTIRLYMDVLVPREDPRGVELVADSGKFQTFVQKVFPSANPDDIDANSNREAFRINDESVADFFADVTPIISVSSSTIRVRALSRPSKDILQPESGSRFGNIVTVTLWESSPDTTDRFTFVNRDYRIKSLSPTPLISSRDLASWNPATDKDESELQEHVAEDREVSDEADQTEDEAEERTIKIQLEYEPLTGLENSLRLTQSPIYSFIPPRFAPAGIALTWAAVAILFTFPLIWFAETFGGAPGEHRSWYRSPQLAIMLLIGLSLTSPILYSTNVLAEKIYNLIPHSEGEQWTATKFWMSALLVFSLGSSGVLLVTARLSLDNVWRSRVRSLAGGVLVSTIVGFVLWLVSAVAHRFWPNSGNYLPRFITTAVIASFLAISLWVLYRLGVVVSRRKFFALGLIFLIAFSAFVMFPTSIQGTELRLAIRYLTTSALIPLAYLVPYLLLLPILNKCKEAESEKGIRWGRFLFAAYLIGATPNVWLVPIPFLLALAIFPRLIVVESKSAKIIKQSKHDVLEQRGMLIKEICENDLSGLSRKVSEELRQDLAGGKISPDGFLSRRASLFAAFESESLKSRIVPAVENADLVLRVGPFSTNWENGLWAVKHGLILALPLSALYLWGLFQQRAHHEAPYGYLSLVVKQAVCLANWSFAAFFFGYWFNYVRGSTGLKKAVTISTAIILCLLPVYVSSSSILGVLFSCAQTLSFFTILGVWAFDHHSIRHALGRFDLRKFLKLEDIPTIAAFGSVTLGTLGIALSSALTGQLQAVLAQVVSFGLQQLPQIGSAVFR